MNREEILRKFLRTISQESANVSMNETLIKRGRRKKIPSGTAVNEEILQEEQQPGPSRQCNNLAESSNDESRDEKEVDRTTCKMCKIPWIELTEKSKDRFQYDICDTCICPKCYDKRDTSTDDDLLCRICIGSLILRSGFYSTVHSGA